MEDDGHHQYGAGEDIVLWDVLHLFLRKVAARHEWGRLSSRIVCTPTQFPMDCASVDEKLVIFDDMPYIGPQALHALVSSTQK